MCHCLCIVLCIFSSGYRVSALRNVTHKETNDVDDYYSNYDYELSVNMTDDSLKRDSLILPNPEFVDAPKYTVDVLRKVELPGDSLADTDLRDHDFIDNLMYIYYGSQAKNGSSLGSEIIIIGSVLSCAAQLLTIFCALLRKHHHGKRDIGQVFLHLMGSLCLANLVFMLGVYATKTQLKCQIIALLLHYLHLLTAFWICLHCCYLCTKFRGQYLPQLRYLCLLAYAVPFVLVLLSYAIAPHSYETKRFCFVSVQKGMLLNYMLPVALLIIITTILSLNGICKINLELSKLELTSSESLNALRSDPDLPADMDKKCYHGGGGGGSVSDEEVTSLRELKCALKALSLVQTSYDVVWFISVLALENGSISNVMPVLYAMASCLLNWYIFGKSKSFVPTLPAHVDEEPMPEETDKDRTAQDNKQLVNPLQSASRCSSSDNIPLLNSSSGGDCYTELRELRHDTISTISS